MACLECLTPALVDHRVWLSFRLAPAVDGSANSLAAQTDWLPIFSARVKLVKFVLRQESGHEEGVRAHRARTATRRAGAEVRPGDTEEAYHCVASIAIREVVDLYFMGDNT